jgi:hypothetical protein
LNLGAPSYTAITSGAPVEQGAPSTTSATDLSHKPIWASEPETLRRQEGNLIGATQSLTTAGSSYQLDMRYLTGPLDVLNAEQYDDGRYTSRPQLSKPEPHTLTAANTTSNPKKRGRKASQHERAENVEDSKRARGRPRLETGDHQDMKEVSSCPPLYDTQFPLFRFACLKIFLRRCSLNVTCLDTATFTTVWVELT